MSSSPPADELFLRRALELARAGVGLASPNPHVGAVIVDANGNIAGSATYTYANQKHAEILALEQAGTRARGGTLYINLEPHAHQGRTPPCTDALIAAGIARVVASMADPNPKVSGRGFEQLRAAGIRVEAGMLEAEARRLNEAFACYIRRGIPLVTLKSALTLDAKIGRRSSSHEPGIPPGGWITGELARAHVHQLRHASDAILVGIGTVLADDPLLTDRSGLPRRRPLLRVILDSSLRLPLDSRIARSASDDVLIFCSATDSKKKRELESAGVRVEQISLESQSPSPENAPAKGLDLRAVLRHLAGLEITGVLVEGGSNIYASALAAEVVDKLFLYYAPEIFGAVNTVPFLASPMERSPVQLQSVSLHQFGNDIALEGYLRDPYAL